MNQISGSAHHGGIANGAEPAIPFWIEKASVTGPAARPGAAPAGGTAPPVPESLVDRRCHLGAYARQPIPNVPVSNDIIAYASPDSTYAVTRKLFDAAKTSILIGIYDFTAAYMKQLVLDAMARGVQVSLMLDVDSAGERRLFDDLVDMGVVGVLAPSCANPSVHVFASAHEKVIVIDDEWTLVQSGNYSANSIPLNEIDGGGPAFRTGNRDTGLAIRSTDLAGLFTKILQADMARGSAGPQQAFPEVPEDAMILVERAPAGRPTALFPSRAFQLDGPLHIQPVLSPDNYMDVVPALIRAATTSVCIEQQYIKANQPSVRMLLDAISEARRSYPALQVRIVLGKVFSRDDLPEEHKNLDILANDYQLMPGTNIRYINTDQLVHCHNKMIVIDGAAVLVSSQNWSDFAVTKNREAGVWVPHPDIARYFEAIFDVDWDSAFTSPEQGFAEAPAGAEGLSGGGFIKVERADYEEL